MENNEKDFSIATLKYEEDILLLTWKEDADVDLESCKEIVEWRKKVQQGEKALLLIDQRQFWTISQEAKEYSKQSDVEALSRAIALFTGDWFPSVLVANSYVKFYKPNVPIKIFKSEAKARKWLLSFKT